MACCQNSRTVLRLAAPMLRQARMMTGGDPGSGAGRGGGSGGSIRDAGGAFGKMEHAHEEQYFRKKEAEQLSGLKKHLDEEVLHHEHEIKRHQDAIKRHKERKTELEEHGQH